MRQNLPGVRPLGGALPRIVCVISLLIPCVAAQTYDVAGPFPTGPGSRFLLADELDGIGGVDLATVHSGGTVHLLHGDGVGGFLPSAAGVLSGAPGFVSIDFDVDGDRDLVLLRFVGGAVQFFEYLEFYVNDGLGNFALDPARQLLIGTDNFPQMLVAADLDGDGREDLAVSDSFDLMVFWNFPSPNGAFTPGPTFTPGGQSILGIDAADLDGDGVLDLALTVYTTDRVHVLLGTGPGAYAPQPPLVTALRPIAVECVDLDGDAIADLAVSCEGDAFQSIAGGVEVFLGDGLGGFGAGTVLPGLEHPGRGLAAMDTDGDGDLDLFASAHQDASGGLMRLRNDSLPGTIAFSPAVVGPAGHWLAVADLDTDGRGDVASLDFVTGEVTVLLTRDPEFRRGDANGDGAVVAIADAVFLLAAGFIPGYPPPPCADAADANDDGAVEPLVDAIHLLSWGFVPGSPPPPAPGPASCGPDPTADAIDCAGGAGCP